MCRGPAPSGPSPFTKVVQAAAENRSGGRSTSFESRTARSASVNRALSTQLFIPVDRLLRRH